MTPWLPDAEPRCRPGCAARRDTCGRFLAELPRHGATIVDGAAQQSWWLSCQLFIAASACKPPSAPARRVHPSL